MRELTKPLNILLDKETSAMLDAIIQVSRGSRGHAIRAMIRYSYKMIVDGIPICASGTSCIVPHMHYRNTSQVAPSTGLVGAPGPK